MLSSAATFSFFLAIGSVCFQLAPQIPGCSFLCRGYSEWFTAASLFRSSSQTTSTIPHCTFSVWRRTAYEGTLGSRAKAVCKWTMNESGTNLSAVLTLSSVCHLRPTFIMEFTCLGWADCKGSSKSVYIRTRFTLCSRTNVWKNKFFITFITPKHEFAVVKKSHPIAAPPWYTRRVPINDGSGWSDIPQIWQRSKTVILEKCRPWLFLRLQEKLIIALFSWKAPIASAINWASGSEGLVWVLSSWTRRRISELTSRRQTSGWTPSRHPWWAGCFSACVQPCLPSRNPWLAEIQRQSHPHSLVIARTRVLWAQFFVNRNNKSTTNPLFPVDCLPASRWPDRDCGYPWILCKKESLWIWIKVSNSSSRLSRRHVKSDWGFVQDPGVRRGKILSAPLVEV